MLIERQAGMDSMLMVTMPTTIVKRDGRIVPFDIERIEAAISRCFASFHRTPGTPIRDLARQAVNIIAARSEQPTVEEVQDTVEMVLQAAGEYEAAKRYILYRAEHAKQRKERPIPEAVRGAFAESDRYFPTQLQKFQFYDKYSRFNYELGRRETWIETVDRALDYLHELSEARLPRETYERVRRGMLEMRAMPSMRLLAMAGPAARRNNITIYNCSYQPVESIDSFVEALIISMSGCGVGFSVESQYVENFPRIRRQSGQAPRFMVVEDSSEGWADALRTSMQTWFDGGDMRFDLSPLRPAGAPLRTKGGRASGPEPLRQMLDFVRARILSRQGSFLRPIDAHDMMCAVGNAAVSGGMRRTAMISLFDYDDAEMRNSKNGDFERDNSQRWNANNSAVWPERGLTQIEIMRQLLEMAEGQRGEPGIFSRPAAINTKPERRAVAEFGTNPCVTADTWVLTTQGPRRVAALVGAQHWTVVDGEAFKTTTDGFYCTGRKPVLRLKTKEGYSVRLTANHRVRVVTYRSRKVEYSEWHEAGQLQPGAQIKLQRHRGFEWNGSGTSDEGWLLGSLVGDGTFSTKEGKAGQTLTSAHLDHWGAPRLEMASAALSRVKHVVETRANSTGSGDEASHETRVSSTGLAALAEQYGIRPNAKLVGDSIESASSEFYCGFLRGLFDADGTVSGNLTEDASVRLTQSNVDTLNAVLRMLLRLGIVSTIYHDRHDAGYRPMPDGHGSTKEYSTQAYHELVISNDNIQVFAQVIGFSDPEKTARLREIVQAYRGSPDRESFIATVESIEPDGEEDVYDCSVPGPNAFDANGFVAHNCGEISLRPWEFCNLSIAVARHGDTLESLEDKVELATIIGTIQSMATYFPGLRPMWQENCEAERLLGVDINGQLDSPVAQDADVQARLRHIALEVNRQTAQALGITVSAAVTCVKPSGNSSQLFDCSSGIHARWSPYYIRNVRVSAHSPLFKVLRDAGAPMDPENGQTREDANTWVIHFPVKAPDGAITRKDRSALQQCEYWLQVKQKWTEHNPSVTITYYPDELIELTKWVWEHRDIVGGMTFLPALDAQYAQMPYQEITREEYEQSAARFPQIDFSKLYRYEEEDLTSAAQELACVSGVCEVDFTPGMK